MGNDYMLDLIMPVRIGETELAYKYIETSKAKLAKVTYANAPPGQSPSLCLYDSGDQNLVLAHINDTVGWGVFANKDFKRGDKIVSYGGFTAPESRIVDTTYSAEGVSSTYTLDAKYYR